MIKRFDRIDGSYIEKIDGQVRYGYCRSKSEDFYDVAKWLKYRDYPGSCLTFYDFMTGDIYQPFKQQKNIVDGDPVYLENAYYFLQGDFNRKIIILYRCLPENQSLEVVTTLDMDGVDLYNLHIIGKPLYIISQTIDESFQCYYPEKMAFSLEDHESVILIEAGRIYLESWVEEGWDTENDCATDDYQFYERLIVKDYAGNKISEEVGCLSQSADGSWWIA